MDISIGEVSEEELLSFYNAENNAEVWINDVYQVRIDRNPERQSYIINVPEVRGKFIHLSIKRIDQKPIHNWRDLQEIKNQLVGKEHEAIEIYPAESRLVDTANQYHLWCFREERAGFPIGFHTRNVSDSDISEILGAVQEPLS